MEKITLNHQFFLNLWLYFINHINSLNEHSEEKQNWKSKEEKIYQLLMDNDWNLKTLVNRFLKINLSELECQKIEKSPELFQEIQNGLIASFWAITYQYSLFVPNIFHEDLSFLLNHFNHFNMTNQTSINLFKNINYRKQIINCLGHFLELSSFHYTFDWLSNYTMSEKNRKIVDHFYPYASTLKQIPLQQMTKGEYLIGLLNLFYCQEMVPLDQEINTINYDKIYQNKVDAYLKIRQKLDWYFEDQMKDNPLSKQQGYNYLFYRAYELLMTSQIGTNDHELFEQLLRIDEMNQNPMDQLTMDDPFWITFLEMLYTHLNDPYDRDADYEKARRKTLPIHDYEWCQIYNCYFKEEIALQNKNSYDIMGKMQYIALRDELYNNEKELSFQHDSESYLKEMRKRTLGNETAVLILISDFYLKEIKNRDQRRSIFKTIETNAKKPSILCELFQSDNIFAVQILETKIMRREERKRKCQEIQTKEDINCQMVLMSLNPFYQTLEVNTLEERAVTLIAVQFQFLKKGTMDKSTILNLLPMEQQFCLGIAYIFACAKEASTTSFINIMNQWSKNRIDMIKYLENNIMLVNWIYDRFYEWQSLSSTKKVQLLEQARRNPLYQKDTEYKLNPFMMLASIDPNTYQKQLHY